MISRESRALGVTGHGRIHIQGLLPELRSLIRDNGLVLVNETNVSVTDIDLQAAIKKLAKGLVG